jgi:putative transposase
MKLLDAALVAAEAHGADVFGGNFDQWCRLNGIPKATAYRHRQRVRQEGAWSNRSRRPHGCPHATPEGVRELVITVRNQLPVHENGAEQIQYDLRALAGEQDWAAKGWRVPARSTIHRVLLAAGLVTPEPRKRPKSSYRRFSYARPRDCYQIDATVIALPSLPVPMVVFDVLDDHSRMLVAQLAWRAEESAGAVAALQRAFAAFGVPAVVLCDNGLAFSARLSRSGAPGRFARLVTGCGSRVIHSSRYHPQTCGKVERHHRTFKAWLATQPAPSTLPELQGLCDRYQLWYNTQRRHSVHNAPPQHAWDSAPELGGPQHLPVQQDALVTTRKVSAGGQITIRSLDITIGLSHAGTLVTVILDGDHVIVYAPAGAPLGHLRLDHTKRRQGCLAAA